MQGTQLRYVIKSVADMDKAVKFYREVLGLTLKFESPGWSEFMTGETTLALHPASTRIQPRRVELGFTVSDVEAFYRDMSAKGVLFSMPPQKLLATPELGREQQPSPGPSPFSECCGFRALDIFLPSKLTRGARVKPGKELSVAVR